MDAETLVAVEGFALVLVLALAFAIGAIFVWGLLKAGRLPHPMSLVVALSMLSFVSIIAYAITEKGELATIGAAGVGALAGAVTSQYTKGEDDHGSAKDDSEGPSDPPATPSTGGG